MKRRTPTAADYRVVEAGGWRLVVLPERWSRDLQAKVIALAAEQCLAPHPQTLSFAWSESSPQSVFYLKVFHGGGGWKTLKDFARSSKAMRFWRQGLALSAAGLNAPLTVAAGEARRWGCLERAFVMTAEIHGQPMPAFLADMDRWSDRQSYLSFKRSGLVRLAQLIREFHRRGFVHGDLVASNLFISAGQDETLTVTFMDNDRTRRYPAWLPQPFWKRNLVQLNRMPLPGITLQDRVRFLEAYLGRGLSAGRDRGFARWLEAKTRRRRMECDGADPHGNFRKLMQWPADTAVSEGA